MSKIELRNVTMQYTDKGKSFLALENISLDIQSGNFVCILGPSGCGKSTLISLLAGLNFASCGDVLIDGAQVTGTGKDRGLVFQHYSLFPWMTAKKNLVFGINQVKKDARKNETEGTALEFLRKVGLEEYANKYPHQLSGGMQQRVAIARTLAMNPSILLMDEPFGAIDTKNRVDLQDLLLDLYRSGEELKTVIFVTHDIDEALVLADRIIFMSPRKIKADLDLGVFRGLSRPEKVQSTEYLAMRNRLVSLFYDDYRDKIDIGGEVGL